MDLTRALTLLPGLVIGLTLHEFAHAWSASLLGDDFARRQGRVSLNPLRHLAPLGTLAILFLPFGWAKPVPVNLYNFKRPGRDYLLTSLAGPLANLIVVGICLLAMQLTRRSYAFGEGGVVWVSRVHLILTLVALINIILATINLLPVPPLDGSKIWPCIIPGLKPSFGAKTTWMFMALLAVLLWTGRLQPLVGRVVDAAFAVMPITDRRVFADHRNRGIAAARAGRDAEADGHLTLALAVNPRSADCLHRRALARQRTGDMAGAIDDAGRAIELEPARASHYDLRSDLLEAEGRETKALADRERAEVVRGDPAAAAAVDRARRANEQVLNRLNQRFPKVDLDRVALSDAIAFVADTSGLTMEVRWDALAAEGLKRTSPITLEMVDEPGRLVLKALLASPDADRPVHYGVANGKVIIPAGMGPPARRR